MPDQIDIPASFAGVADVTGKRVVISGASRGLGEGVARALAAEGLHGEALGSPAGSPDHLSPPGA